MRKTINRKFKNNEEGFTLIEMLLVLLVISVLIILIIPNIAAQSRNVQDICLSPFFMAHINNEYSLMY